VESYHGDPAKSLVAVADSWKADLIVVGANEKTLVKRTLLGSVSQAVLERASCPVLIVRDSGMNNCTGYRKVLVALDGSQHSDLALDWICNHPWWATTEFHFVTIAPEMPKKFSDPNLNVESAMYMLESQAFVREQAMQRMEQSLIPVASTLLQWQCHLDAADGDPAHKIVEIAASEHAELIVMGSHGLTGLGKLLIGSVSSFVSSHAPSSVLVVKSKALPAERQPDVADDMLFEHPQLYPSDAAYPDVSPHVICR
jgi:nucleotide-binding universal stress UspA family protein